MWCVCAHVHTFGDKFSVTMQIFRLRQRLSLLFTSRIVEGFDGILRSILRQLIKHVNSLSRNYYSLGNVNLSLCAVCGFMSILSNKASVYYIETERGLGCLNKS